MAYEVAERSSTLDAGARVYVLSGAGNRAEIAPGLGFNCVAWEVPSGDTVHQLLYADPKVFAGAKPTRSGIPVLFPFPNRIRGGRFQWAGREYSLPLNDPAQANAIHGWACRYPWRVVETGADDESAYVTGEFWASRDAPEVRQLWPADYRIQITCRLANQRLRLEAGVETADDAPLPFGLGFHPYVRLPLRARTDGGDSLVQANVSELWELQDSLPTGRRVPLDSGTDLRHARRLKDLDLDTLYVSSRASPAGEGLVLRGQISDPGEEVRVQMLSSVDFGQLVAFTPPHRQAVSLEPYTCTTDAINLQQRGVEAGLRVIKPGERWSGVMELAFAGP